MKVLKFGGTSLGEPARMQRVADIVTSQGKTFVVLSAVAGTTDALVEIVESIREGDNHKASNLIETLLNQYQVYLVTLFKPESQALLNNALDYIETQFEELKVIAQQSFVASTEFQVLAKGEMISTFLFSLLLQERNVSVKLFSVLDVLRLSRANQPDTDYLKERLKALLNANEAVDVWVTQGFICRNAFGDISNLKRGGSDYSASLIAAAIQSNEVQIWTDIDGMHNNDPRFIQKTQPIRELSFDEAAELAYFGAKILHPSSIKPARQNNIPVKLLNTLQPHAVGTVISNRRNASRIKAVAAKSGITAIKIKSSEMLQAPGFLRRVFEVFELFHTSIDVITTSEVAVSVTIDDTSHLQPIVNTLAEFGTVEVDQNLAIICVVGNFVAESTGIACQVIQSLKQIPIRMISYGGSAHNITLLISNENKVQALQALHEGLFDDC
ncbi:aspartate kinase [Aliikangiella sp. IMCC44632]